MSTPGPVQRLFNSFADALGRQALPALVSWLRTRLGDGVVIKDFRSEGSRIHIADAVLPLGPAAVLRVDEACFRLHSRAVLGAPVASLESLRGVLFVPHHEGDGTTFWAPVEFAQAESPKEESWIDGTLATTGAHWTESAGLGEQAPLDGTLSILVTSQDWTLRSAELTALHSTISGSLTGSLAEGERTLQRAEVQVSDARVGHFMDALVALLGRTIGFGIPIPEGSLLSGTASMREAGEFTASMALRSPHSKLQLETEGTLESFSSLRVLGFVALHEVLGNGSDLSLGIDCQLEGPLRGPDGVVQIQLGPHELAVTVQTRPTSFSFSGATAALAVELAQIFDFKLGMTKSEPRSAPDSGFALPEDALIDATLVYDQTVTGVVTVHTERTKIRIDPLEFDPKTNDFGQSRVSGTLEANDAVAIGMFPSPVRPWEGTAELDLALQGAGLGTHVEGNPPGQIPELGTSRAGTR